MLRYVAANVRTLRVALGWTQAELAEAANMDPRHLQRVERADVNLTVGALTSLADALKTSPAKLFDIADLPPVLRGRPKHAEPTRKRKRP